MPEAPEVRLVQDYLNSNIPTEPLTQIRVYAKDFLDSNTLYHLNEHIGQKLFSIHRRGKSLFFYFENDYSNSVSGFLNGLGMTGYWVVTKEKGDLKHCQFELEFGKGDKLIRWQYHDIRGFGRFTSKLNYDKLGQDIFNWDANTFAYKWPNETLKTKRAIKDVLLDQSFIAGIGNYLAAEILFEAKIHPQTRTNTLDKDKLVSILNIAKDLAWKFYNAKGNAFKDFQAPEGLSTGAQLLKVYGQKICQICQTNIENLKINNRSSYYCPNCQRKEK